MNSNSAIRLEWNTDSVMAEWYRANGILRAQWNADSAMAELLKMDQPDRTMMLPWTNRHPLPD
jgi:hypothetical protein